MSFDLYDLTNKKKNHPSWRLMTADNGPLIISFLDLVFREENQRQVDEHEMVLKLEDYLYQVRDGREDDPYPRSAADYLEEWTAPGRDWLRKYYPAGSDIPHYELTPGTEKVLQWVDSLTVTRFIGTESRLQTCFDLLRQIVRGVEENSEVRIRELEEQKSRIDREISRIQAGDIPMMDQRQIRERFLQFKQIAHELRSDFTAVEGNFRELDREIREEIATWEGEKGGLLEQFFGDHDRITHSDEGQSFRAFWDFIMSPDSQEELSLQLDRVFDLEELGSLRDDPRLRRIHFDWIDAGEKTQRTVARLSGQLRRYLDNRAFLENRRITELLDRIEKQAVALKDRPPTGTWMSLEHPRAQVRLPMEQPMFSPPVRQELISRIEVADEEEIDTEKLFNLVYIDRERLQGNIEKALRSQQQIRLDELIGWFPLEQGLSELITYIHMAEEDPLAAVSDEVSDQVVWDGEEGRRRSARFPRIIYTRRSAHGRT